MADVSPQKITDYFPTSPPHIRTEHASDFPKAEMANGDSHSCQETDDIPKNKIDVIPMTPKAPKNRSRKGVTCTKVAPRTPVGQSSPAARRQSKKKMLESNKRVTDYFPVRRSSRMPSSELKKKMQIDIEEAIMNKCEDGLKVVDIEGKGRGVITTKKFKRGEFVVEYVGDLIELSMAKDREADYSRCTTIGCYMYYFLHKNQRYCIDATAESGCLGRLLNHSRVNPNCATKLVEVNNCPYLILVALRDLNIGEELLYDYGDRSKESLIAHPWLAL